MTLAVIDSDAGSITKAVTKFLTPGGIAEHFAPGIGASPFEPDLWHRTEEAKYDRPKTATTQKPLVYVRYGESSRMTIEILIQDLRTRTRTRRTILPPITVWGFTLPAALSAFREPINRSRAMLDLEDDWDDEGSPGYDEATWRRAVGLTIDTAVAFWRNRHSRPPAPMVLEGPEGSIDILWQFSQRQLLLNVPSDLGAPTTYYGHDQGNENRTVEGEVDPVERNEWLLVWLTE